MFILEHFVFAAPNRESGQGLAFCHSSRVGNVVPRPSAVLFYWKHILKKRLHHKIP
jgi:hypothetical protein